MRLASPAGQTIEWQVGAFYTREASSIIQSLPSFIIPTQAPSGLPSLENVNLDALYREWSGFGQITYHFNPAFDLSLGGRWSENKQSENESISGTEAVVGPPRRPAERRPAPTSSTRSRRAGM